MKRFLFVLAALIASLIAASAQAPGGAMYVAVKKADVRASTGFFASLRGTLELGSPVTVLRANGKWTEISSANPALSGWTASAALTGKRISPSGYTPRAGEVAMAGKGFSAEVEQIYREGEELDYTPVDAMESFAVDERDLYDFLAQGRLGTGE
ncbi:MAG: hypothetical protein LBQ67_04120 [Treponema sp.]|jgi:hypothetical protein|nr:hypothetical protein [Treponema sp.]